MVKKGYLNAPANTEEQALAGGQLGRPKGLGRASLGHEYQIRKMLTDKKPKQFMFDSALWTCRAVMAQIDRDVQIDFSLLTVQDYLRSWGIIVQRTARQSIEQDHERESLWK